MQFSDLRYLAAYLIPLSTWAGLTYGGWLTPGAVWVGFVLVPLVDFLAPTRTSVADENSLETKSRHPFFDYLLYLHVPIVYGMVLYFGWVLAHRDFSVADRVWSVFNMGIFLGVCGINVAHELGHRPGAGNAWVTRLLLLPVLYSHFTLEHNYGHHLRVATPEDPATARKNEPLYAFFIRSMTGSYLHAWEIGLRQLKSAGRPVWHHEMIWSHVAHLLLLAGMWWLAGPIGLLTYAGAALVGMLTLESVNYIEHYGLVRKMLPSGRYEPQRASHAWNSNHELGRIMLFELVLHADHHLESTRKYQTLRHREQSPQLPFGYPMSILLALVPPVWFRIMNPRLEAIESAG